MSDKETDREAVPRVPAITTALQTAFSAENHESLDGSLTALMIQLSVEAPPVPQPVPAPKRRPLADSIRQLVTATIWRKTPGQH
ncbi:MAG TPA: hypothetical protein VF637_15945 [Sphingomicrobium sp.]|jgi:hypothetical protein